MPERQFMPAFGQGTGKSSLLIGDNIRCGGEKVITAFSIPSFLTESKTMPVTFNVFCPVTDGIQRLQIKRRNM